MNFKQRNKLQPNFSTYGPWSMHFQWIYMWFQAMRGWKQQIFIRRGILSSFNIFFETLKGSFSTVSRSCDTEVSPPYRVVFFGTDQISLETFSLLHQVISIQRLWLAFEYFGYRHFNVYLNMFCISCVQATLQHAPLISHLSLVCPADKPRSTGRSAHMDTFCPTKQYALQNNLTLQQPVTIDFKLTGFDLDFGSTDESMCHTVYRRMIILWSEMHHMLSLWFKKY